MNINARGLDFHQTFKPERSCLTSLLVDLPACTGKTAEEISKITGIPTGSSSGKVVPTISYLEYMGLITQQIMNKKYQLSYTLVGKCVTTEDPGFIEDLTLLLLHCMIARKQNGAELWSFIICDLLPKYHGIIGKENLNKELDMHFGKDVNLAPFNGTYTGIFEQLGILKISSNGYAIHSHSFNTEFLYLYGLILYEYWEDWLSQFTDNEKIQENISESEITADQIKIMGFRYPFGWSERDEYKTLEVLHDKGVISLNRQMSPFTVRKIISKEEIVDLLYSELC